MGDPARNSILEAVHDYLPEDDRKDREGKATALCYQIIGMGTQEDPQRAIHLLQVIEKFIKKNIG